MMSINAYNIGGWLLTGAFSLHDLLTTMTHVEHIPREDVDEYLHEGLRELAERGWVRWEYEPDYGNAPSERPQVYDGPHFEHDWERCISHGTLREGVPDAENPTMLFEATDALVEELRRELGDTHLNSTSREGE